MAIATASLARPTMALNETASGKVRPPVPDATGGAVKAPRLASLDAYRGFIMLMMASAGFHVADVAAKKPSSEAWRFLAEQTEHVAWRGCSFWDLIQPSFMFMVGVAMAYSYSARQARGQSYGRMLGHAVV